MKNRSLNKRQLLIWLVFLCAIQLIWTHLNPAEGSEYSQWEARQQAHDQRLKPPAAAPMNQKNYYLSKPELTAGSTAGKISLNRANAEQLQELQGIGQKKAEAIVNYRSKNGKFKSIEELQQVKGIGPAIFAKNKQRLAL
ncbi:ComEA family DNA-binding protein [Acinetobacter tianfuensis]|uniref:ComEA family DNA-binding protein n=1 Tax=Acinetobacter tianfuensis TaxID=2419603 RepID=A0A3A8EWK7_9GAMM|nr:ComEA family DNA-binding protein [Acinetobacter tianfuensis]